MYLFSFTHDIGEYLSPSLVFTLQEPSQKWPQETLGAIFPLSFIPWFSLMSELLYFLSHPNNLFRKAYFSSPYLFHNSCFVPLGVAQFVF